MYARPMRTEDGRISVPENYDGVAFMEKSPDSEQLPERSIKVLGTQSSEAKISPKITPTRTDEELRAEATEASTPEAPNAPRGIKDGFLGFLERMPKNLFKSLGEGDGYGRFSLPKIGKEEILIIAMAAFLLFSKDGDKECAIMLILLLLVAK